jgi:hypothetical protein
MMQEGLTERVMITSLLARDHPEIVNPVKSNCKQLTLLEGANDYWCRDFLPVPVTPHKYIQFTFDPPYYKYPGYTHLKTNPDKLDAVIKSKCIKSPIVLDGGNLFIITTKPYLQIVFSNTIHQLQKLRY